MKHSSANSLLVERPCIYIVRMLAFVISDPKFVFFLFSSMKCYHQQNFTILNITYINRKIAQKYISQLNAV